MTSIFDAYKNQPEEEYGEPSVMERMKARGMTQGAIEAALGRPLSEQGIAQVLKMEGQSGFIGPVRPVQGPQKPKPTPEKIMTMSEPELDEELARAPQAPPAGFGLLASRYGWELAKGGARGLANAAEGVGGFLQKGGAAIAGVFQSDEQEARADKAMQEANQYGKQAIANATAPAQGYEVANKVGEFLGEQAPLLAASAGTGTIARGAANLAGKGIASVAPKLGGLAKTGKVLAGAAEGVGFMAGSEWMQGKKLGADDVATGAAFGAALPVLGIIGGGVKSFLGKYLPESLVKSATRLKPNQKIKIAERLEKMGELENVETAEQWLIQNKLGGSPKEIGNKLLQMSKDARTQKLEALASLPTKFKDPKIQQFAEEATKILNQPGLEDAAGKAIKIADSMKKGQQGFTLKQIDELKTLFDDNTNIFNAMGSVKESAKAKGLANLRGHTQKFIEDQASKAGVANIKQLNQTVSLTRMFGDALKAQEVGAGGNALAKLSDLIVGTGVAGSALGGGAALGGGDLDFGDVVRAAGLGLSVVALNKVMTPTRRMAIANFLSKKLSSGEAGAILKFMQGDRSALTPKLKNKVQEAIAEAL